MSEWNFADVWEAVADAVPDRPALRFGDRERSWRELAARADGVAAALLAAGLVAQETVALMLYNGPEYMESAFGSLKARLVPVNTNYRYGADELVYLWDNADVRAVVFHGALAETVAVARESLPDVRLWLHVDDGTGPRPSWAAAYEAAVAGDGDRPALPGPPRGGDDLILIYTGGTTGRPKGVMWRQHDLYRVSDTARDPGLQDLDHVRRRIAEGRPAAPVGLSAAPLMHGTGFVFAGTVLSRAGTLVTLPGRSFDVVALLDAISTERVTALCIVGDAFCLPIVEALDVEPDRWDISCLTAVSSAGMAWSTAVKERLLDHAPEAVLVDTLNSSEASGMGRAVTSRTRPSGRSGPARFRLGDNAFVIDDAGDEVTPGSGEVGRVAVRGHMPLGYYGDPEKTAATFPVIRGERCAVPGDYARVEADGTVTLLGRGSTSINTGGEKVYPEEVEEALRSHPDVRDAVVVGAPDPRFGEVVCAEVALRPDAVADEAALVAHVRERLARYKAPRHVVLVDTVGRGPNGKADYPAARARVRARVAEVAPHG